METTLKTNIKRIILYIMIALLVMMSPGAVSCYAEGSTDEPVVSGRAAFLMDAKTGEILFDYNSTDEEYPASLTKMMTAILILERFTMDHVVTIKKEAVNPIGNNMNLKEGEQLTIGQLLNVLMVYSANDAAVALAIEHSGSVEEFAKAMNKKAKEIGCKHTNFINPNGFTNDAIHHTTARDMATIALYGMQKKDFAKIVKKKSYTLQATNKNKQRTFETTNKLLADGPLHYDGTIGVKTGFMALSGQCFVGMAERDGMTLIGVSLGCETEEDRFKDVAKLFDYGFDNYKSFRIMAENESTGDIKVKYGHNTFVETVVPDGAYITMPKSGDESLATTEVELKDHVDAPIKKGTKVGVCKIYENEKKVGQTDVVIARDVKKGGPWTALYISDMAFYIAAGVLVLFLLLIIFIKSKKRKARKRREEQRRRQREARAMQIAAERKDKERRGWPY